MLRSRALTTATPLEVAVDTHDRLLSRIRLSQTWPIVAPCAFLLAGALIGLPFSLDSRVAVERLIGLVIASFVALLALLALRRVQRPAPLLVTVALVALLGSLWVIAASGPDVFRGSLGSLLDLAFRPLFGLVDLTDPVEVTNTRFIVGYNGLVDLCLVAIFCSGALLLDRPAARRAVPLAAIVVVALVLLVGAGARGGLTGLAAGLCAVGVLVWPRRYALAAVVAAPAALAITAITFLDKGLEFSSTAGRLTYWSDLVRLLVEYPLTGIGLGVDTANAIALQYEINPDPERVFYAHDTFVQSYLEQGPLGLVGMLLVPAVVIGAVALARGTGLVRRRRPLVMAGVGVVFALEAHGLTDQVVTTNVGTTMLLLGASAVLAGLTQPAVARLGRWTARVSIGVVALLALALLTLAATPTGRAQVLLNLGGLRMDEGFALSSQAPGRSAALADAESWLSQALAQDGGHPAVLRDLAWVRAARFDDSRALANLQQAAESPRIDAFDMLQIAHVYRDLGAADQAYAWAARAYAAWDRAPEDAVMQVYAQSTLTDDRARTLATQGEAAMRARTFTEANALFQQALTFEPADAGRTYLEDRVGASARAIAKYGG